jgi:hypothetical protein
MFKLLNKEETKSYLECTLEINIFSYSIYTDKKNNKVISFRIITTNLYAYKLHYFVNNHCERTSINIDNKFISVCFTYIDMSNYLLYLVVLRSMTTLCLHARAHLLKWHRMLCMTTKGGDTTRHRQQKERRGKKYDQQTNKNNKDMSSGNCRYFISI